MLTKKEADLMQAAMGENVYIVQNLLKNIENINAQDHDSFTALIIATIKGQREMVQLLLEHGADVNISTKEGETALRIASKLGYKEIEQLLDHANTSNMLEM